MVNALPRVGSDTVRFMSHPGAGAFEIGPVDAPRVVLFHGLTGAPSELWPLGCGLAAAGFRVEAPVLPGHGTRPEALLDVDADDVLAFATQVARRGAAPVAVGGMSFGALVALCVAAEVSSQSLVLLAPAAVMTGNARLFDRLGVVPWGHWMKRLIAKAKPDPGEPQVRDGALTDLVARAAVDAPFATGFDGRYQRVPLRWSTQLRRARRLAREAATRVRCPSLIVHGALDATASLESAVEVASWLHDVPVSVRVLAHSRHVLPLGPERGRLAVEVARFLSQRAQIDGFDGRRIEST